MPNMWAWDNLKGAAAHPGLEAELKVLCAPDVKPSWYQSFLSYWLKMMSMVMMMLVFNSGDGDGDVVDKWW